MAKKKTEEPVEKSEGGHTVKSEVEFNLPVKTELVEETKTEEVVTRKSLSGVETKVTQKLVAKQVFEPMTLTHRTVWVKE